MSLLLMRTPADRIGRLACRGSLLAILVWLPASLHAQGSPVPSTRLMRHEANAETAPEPQPSRRIPLPEADDARWLVRLPGTAPALQPSGETPQPSTFDRIWQFARWYRNDSNPVVQEVLFSGRYQHDFAAIDADQGEHDEWNARRMRLGPRIRLFRTFQVHVEVDLNPQEHDPLYVRLTDAYVEWSRSDSLAVTAGKQGVPFTLDGSTSSKELLTIDRSNLANNIWFPQEYMPGVSASGSVSAWRYHAGIYSGGRANREYGDFSGSLFTLASLGYDFAGALRADEALLTGSYVYQDADPANTFTRQLGHIGSVAFKLESGRWGVGADVSAASGHLGQPDLWGATAMPYVRVTRALQVVGRYTLLNSDGPNGVRLQTYESRVVGARGDLYREVYGGANYYFYGHKLKLQTGVQFADLDDDSGGDDVYAGVSWTSGLRVSW